MLAAAPYTIGRRAAVRMGFIAGMRCRRERDGLGVDPGQAPPRDARIASHFVRIPGFSPGRPPPPDRPLPIARCRGSQLTSA